MIRQGDFFRFFYQYFRFIHLDKPPRDDFYLSSVESGFSVVIGNATSSWLSAETFSSSPLIADG